MPIYTPPNFNLLCNVWVCRVPADGDPDHEDIPCQKYIYSRLDTPVSPPVEAEWWQMYLPPILVRTPRTGIFAGPPHTWDAMVFEVPAGSGQLYRSYWREVFHEGFVNEYAGILVVQCDEDGKSIPPPSYAAPLGIAPDVCALPPEVEEIVVGEFIIDSGTDDVFGYVARAADKQNYYLVLFNGTAIEFQLLKYEADVVTVLDSQPIGSTPAHNSTCDISFKLTGTLLEVEFITDSETINLSATDSTFPIGGYYGVLCQPTSVPACNNFNVFHDLVLVLQDLYSDTAGTNLDVHTMNTGTGWVYLGNGAELDIDSSGNNCVGVTFGDGSYGFTTAFTAYP